MVGLLEDWRRHAVSHFAAPRLVVVLLGEVREELGASEWLALRRGLEAGFPPSVDLEHERRLLTLLERSVAAGAIASAHDVAEGGVVREVTDQEILDAKAQVGSAGMGCEPASAASVAGAKRLREEGIIAPSDRVVCILTGHMLKDPTATMAYHTTDQDEFNRVLGSRGVRRASFANRAVAVPNDLDEIIKAIQLYS